MAETPPIMNAPPPPSTGESHPLVSLFAAFFWVIYWLLSWFSYLVAFVTITIPKFIITVVSYSFTLTLNFWTLALLFGLGSVALAVFIRIKYLGRYSSLREPPLAKPGADALHPDVNTVDPPPAFHDYLDDFLQAIRIFGFLEKPVFHELARHVQTRRLIAGDSLSLDQDKSFYCVMDGTVEVYAKGQQQPNAALTQWENEDMNGYQLLNEVGGGATLSSLFTILSLFTEDVQIAWQEDDKSGLGSMMRDEDDEEPPFEMRGSSYELVLAPGLRRSRAAQSSEGSTIQPIVTEVDDDDSPPSRSASRPLTPTQPSRHRRNASMPRPSIHTSGIHHGTIARATTDTTLAVIPAEAFKRLTKKFPKASGHIVQVILTRFSRVTFHAAHKYLGLTSELLRTEKAINDLACHPLPSSFYEGGGLQALRHRLDTAGDSDPHDSEDDYFGVVPDHPPARIPGGARSLSRITSAQTITESPVSSKVPPPFTPYTSHGSRTGLNAGDLLTMTGHASAPHLPSGRDRSSSVAQAVLVGGKRIAETPRARATSTMLAVEDEFNLRDEVMSCIAKSIGLLQPPIESDSVDAGSSSPGVFSMDTRSTTSGAQGLFTSAFGGLPILQDDSSSSVAMSAGDGVTPFGLDNDVELLFFAAGSLLVSANEKNAGLFYVIDGFLDVSLPLEQPADSMQESTDRVPLPKPGSQTGGLGTKGSRPKSSTSQGSGGNRGPRTRADTRKPEPATAPPPMSKHLFTVKPGGIAGYLSSLTNAASFVDIRAKTDAYVGFLPAASLERLIEKNPIVLLTLSKRLISLLSPLVLQIDAALDWHQVDGGQVLWRPGEESKDFYIVINGRLRSLADKPDGGVKIQAEYGMGDSIGELDVIARSRRRTTLHAIRDTELVRLPVTLFNAISARHPQVTSQLLRIIASRVRDEVDSSAVRPHHGLSDDLRRNNFNMKTVAILPVSNDVPIDGFARKLHAALEGVGARTSYLNQASVMSHLGRHAFTRMGQLKVASWLTDQELRYRMVMYVADAPVSAPWTQTCIRMADTILLVGIGDIVAPMGEYERLLLSIKTTARKELVLLHATRNVAPGSTREWLKSRPWAQGHMHVELPGIPGGKATSSFGKDFDDATAAAQLKLQELRERLEHQLRRYTGQYFPSRGLPSPRRPHHMSDFSRLARRLTGQSIGVVLGGGGARGISHVGVLRALEEYHIPIDHIGGTSIGALMGGLYAREMDIFSTTARAKQFSSRMASIWRIISDLTWPVVAYTTGHEFNRSIYKSFYDLHIEDMWLPFFCNTTNIRLSRMEIHDTGYAWRFVRASMTLVGLLPPLSDNGEMLVDGGYLDNLPVPTMFSMGANTVFAVDVGSLDDTTPRVFGDTISGWWLLLNKWNPFSTVVIPSIAEIQARLAYVSSVVSLEQAKVARGALYMQMPVQDYGTLQFGKFAEIEEVGYRAALEMLETFKKEGRLPTATEDGIEGAEKKRKGRGLRRNSI